MANATIVNPTVARYVGEYGQEIPNDNLLARFEELDKKLIGHGYDPLNVKGQFDSAMKVKLGFDLITRLRKALSDPISKDIYSELIFGNTPIPVDNVVDTLLARYLREGLLTEEVRAGINRGIIEFYEIAKSEGINVTIPTGSSQTVDDVTVSAMVAPCSRKIDYAMCMQTPQGEWYVKDMQLMHPEVRVYGKLDAEDLEGQLKKIAAIKGMFEESFGELLRRP